MKPSNAGKVRVERPVRPILKGQSVEYYVLAALERGARQGCWIQSLLVREADIKLQAQQISGALQRLKRDNLCDFVEGLWTLKGRA